VISLDAASGWPKIVLLTPASVFEDVSRIGTAVYWMIGIVLLPLAFLIVLLTLFGADRSVPGRARQYAAKAQIAAFLEALKTYKDDTGDFPTTSQGIEALRTNPGVAGWRGPYVDKDIGPDPWGRAYLYDCRADELPEIISLGNEGRLGPRSISSLRRRERLEENSLEEPVIRIALFLLSVLVLFGYPRLPRLLAKRKARTRAC
jgi:general secretion pathway protein G